MINNLFEEYITNSRIYNEASFAEGAIDKIINNFLKVVGKRAGLKFKGPVVPYSIQFKNKYGNFEGVKFMTSDYKKAIRINWIAGKSTSINNIDFWTSPGSKQKNLDCSELNIVQIVDLVSTVLGGKAFYKESLFLEASAQFTKNERKEIFDEIITSNRIKVNGSDFKAAKILKLANEYAKKKGYNPFSFAMVNEYVNNYKNGIYVFGQDPSKGLLDKIRSGSKEVVKVDSAADKVWQKLKEDGIEAKLTGEATFKKIVEYTKLLIKGKSSKKLLIIAGDPGLGKSVEVKKELNDKIGAGNWVKFSGAISAFSLYQELYKNNGKIMLLDDIDDIYKNKTAVNLLKAATESNDERVIDWNTRALKGEDESDEMVDDDNFEDEEDGMDDDNGENKKGKEKKKKKAGDVPRKFLYTGRIISLTNLYYKDLPGSLLSRALKVEVDFTPEQALDRIKSKLKEFEPDVPMKIKERALKFLQEISPILEKIDFRKVSSVLEDFMIEGITDKEARQWAIAGLAGDAGAAGKRQ
jgi:hypothetical protein